MLHRLASLRLWLVASMVGAAVIGLVVARFVLADLNKSSEVAKDRRKAAFVAASIARQLERGARRPQLALMQSVLANDQIVVYRDGRLYFSGTLPRKSGELELTAVRPFQGGRVLLRDYESPSGLSPTWTDTAVTAGVLLFVILAAAATATFLVEAVRRPVERAVAAARRVAAGDLSARIGPTGPEELIELGRAFDDMAERLEVADRDQRRFLADVAHEIATPLNTIAGYALGLADQELHNPEELHEASEVVRSEMHRLQSLLDNLRQLIRLDLAEPGPLEHVDLSALLRRLETRFAPAARSAGITLRLRGRGSIDTDPRLLETVLDNLVFNAIRYTPAGGEVTVTSQRRRRDLVLSVKDTGIGIPAEHQRRIFDRFYRVDQARDRASGGSGIGLALARRAAQALGGRIELDSTPGQGTEFRLVLPADSRQKPHANPTSAVTQTLSER